MSAYLVSNETINCIVNGYLDRKLHLPMTPQQFGELLVKQNLISLNARYNDISNIDKEVKMINYRFLPEMYDKEVLIGCIRCWNYQSCESNDYEKSEAYGYLTMLALNVIYDNSDTRQHFNMMIMNTLSENYPDAPWGID